MILKKNLLKLLDSIYNDPSLLNELLYSDNKHNFAEQLNNILIKNRIVINTDNLIKKTLVKREKLYYDKNKIDKKTLDNWIPVQLHSRRGSKYMVFYYAGNERFTEPFFYNTITDLSKKIFNQIFLRSIRVDRVTEYTKNIPSVNPTGFIFHMSRCGSTLISRMLASVPKNIVISEAPVINDVLYSDQIDVGLLKSVIKLLGQKRFDQESNLFIKFDCWHTKLIPIISKIFPGVPIIFVYRYPLEVLVSNIRFAGVQMNTEMIDSRWYGLEFPHETNIRMNQYYALVLRSILSSVKENYNKVKIALVNYNELPEILLEKHKILFNVEFTESELAIMKNASSFNAKKPEETFKDDTLEKRDEANEEIRKLSDGLLLNLYEELELLRLKNIL